MLSNRHYFDYDDVLILPKPTRLGSRKDVSLIGNYQTRSGHTIRGVPIMAANMDTTGTFAIAYQLMAHHMFTALHKFYSAEEIHAEFKGGLPLSNTFVTIGLADEDLGKLQLLYRDFGDRIMICMDVANGYTDKFLKHIAKVRALYPKCVIMAGNVATPDILDDYASAGADIVKIGIGPGNFCRTRTTAGVGVPQLSAILDCAEEAQRLDLLICADGGVNEFCDFAKAMAAGADFVMAGSMFAGHTESGGDLIKSGKQKFKVTYGMSSKTAMNKYYGEVSQHRASEGRTVMVPYKGPVRNTVMDILGSLRSTMTYTDTAKIEDLYSNAELIPVKNTINIRQVASTIGH